MCRTGIIAAPTVEQRTHDGRRYHRIRRRLRPGLGGRRGGAAVGGEEAARPLSK